MPTNMAASNSSIFHKIRSLEFRIDLLLKDLFRAENTSALVASVFILLPFYSSIVRDVFSSIFNIFKALWVAKMTHKHREMTGRSLVHRTRNPAFECCWRISWYFSLQKISKKIRISKSLYSNDYDTKKLRNLIKFFNISDKFADCNDRKGKVKLHQRIY